MKDSGMKTYIRSAAAECRKNNNSKTGIYVPEEKHIWYDPRTHEGILVRISPQKEKDKNHVEFSETGLYSTYLDGKTTLGIPYTQPVRYEALSDVKKTGDKIRFSFDDGGILEARFSVCAEATAALLHKIMEYIAGKRAEEKKFSEFTKEEQNKALSLYRQAKKLYTAGDYGAAAGLLDQVVPYHLAKAEYLAAACCYLGRGKEENHETAKVLLERSALRGYPEAMFALACLYHQGKVPFACKEKEDLAWLEKAAKSGHPTAAYFMGRYYWSENYEKKQAHGTYCPEADRMKSFSWYTKAWELGDKTAAGGIGLSYELGFGTPQSDNEALLWYEKLLPYHTEASSYLGRLAAKAYSRGNYTECVRILEECIHVPDAENKYLYAECFFNGNGKSQDYAKAFSLYQEVAEEMPGFYPAIYRLGLCYENGYGVGKDRDKAIELYLKACIYNTDARDRLLQLGENASRAQNHEEAVNYYTLLAKRGIAEGKYRLGKCYHDGRGVTKDAQIAADLYESAARGGCVEAMLAYARCLLNADGRFEDHMEAGKWFLHAAAQGNTEAADELARLRHLVAKTYGGDPGNLVMAGTLMKAANSGHAADESLLGNGDAYREKLPEPQGRPEHEKRLNIIIADPSLETVSRRIAKESDVEDVTPSEKSGREIISSGLPGGKVIKAKKKGLPRWLLVIPAAALVVLLFYAKNLITDYQESLKTRIPYSAVELNGHYYYLYDDAENWMDAKYLCETKGGHLATITTQEENDFVYSYLEKKNAFPTFIGLYSGGHMYDPIWFWVTDEPFDYSAWADGEPNADNGGFEFFGSLTTGGWNDTQRKNFETNNLYLCEWDSEDTEDQYDPYWEYNGHYYKVYNGAESWDDARQKAEDMGGYLACVTTEEENIEIHKLFRSTGNYTGYIGLYNSGEDPAALQFSWVDGEPVEYTDWKENEPNYSGGTELYAMYDESGYWNDVDDSGTEYFVVEWDSEEDIK